jgi:hypothetical protein
MLISTCCKAHVTVEAERDWNGKTKRGKYVCRWWECTKCRQPCDTEASINLGAMDHADAVA